MEWTVAVVIIALVGFALTILELAGKITKPINALNSSIVALSVKFDDLTNRIERDDCNNEKEHIAIWDAVEKQGDILNEHEKRITIVEHQK